MYRTAAQIDGWTQVLANAFAECTRTALPNTTHAGTTVHMVTLAAGGGEDRRGVLLVGGTHARELINPDLLLEFAAELLVAYDNNDDIVYGSRTWSASTVRLIMETLRVHIICTVNPDGRNHVFSTDAMWRKNRRDNPGTCDGVDINRNAAPLWSTQPGSSCNPCSDTYAGPDSFSEPESKNVRWVLDNRRVDCFVDVHSFSELVLYPWGHAPTQTTDPTQRFPSLPGGTCTTVVPPGYAEYMDPVDLQRFQSTAQAAVDAISDVSGTVYTPQPGIGLYATTGTLGDYPYSRHVSDPSARRTYSFTFETAPNDTSVSVQKRFQPDDPEPFKKEAKSGLMAVLQQCICAIELVGTRVLGNARAGNAMRVMRDQILPKTAAGREWIALFERNQAQVALLAIEDERAAEMIAKLIESVEDVVEGDGAIDKAHVEQVDALVERLGERQLGEQAERDLDVIVGQIRRAVGRRRDDLVEQLLARPPYEKAAD